MPITETLTLTYPASKGWVVKAALQHAGETIRSMEASGVDVFDDPAGTMTVQVMVATHIHARGAV